jgi:hypothetical protein
MIGISLGVERDKRVDYRIMAGQQLSVGSGSMMRFPRKIEFWQFFAGKYRTVRYKQNEFIREFEGEVGSKERIWLVWTGSHRRRGKLGGNIGKLWYMGLRCISIICSSPVD